MLKEIVKKESQGYSFFLHTLNVQVDDALAGNLDLFSFILFLINSYFGAQF